MVYLLCALFRGAFMANVAIIGAGIAGLHLGLLLRRHGAPVTLFADQGPEQLRVSQLKNIALLSPRTYAREAELGVERAGEGATELQGLDFCVMGHPPAAFHGAFDRPWRALDTRLYLSRLMEDFAARGGKLKRALPRLTDLRVIAEEHELIVVTSRKMGLAHLFPRVPVGTPDTRRPRVICVGLFKGLASTGHRRLSLHVSPGCGEIISAELQTREGNVASILFEGVPGGPFQPLFEFVRGKQPAHVAQAAKQLLRVHAPALHDLIVPETFGLTRPLDVWLGVTMPAVRRAVAHVGRDKLALAIGDAHITNAPLTAQGMNLASQAAWEAGKAILSARALDEDFCRNLARQLSEQARGATAWTNLMLGPLPAHVWALLKAAAQSRPVADSIANNFNDPDRQWSTLATRESTHAFLEHVARQQRAPNDELEVTLTDQPATAPLRTEQRM